MVAGIIGSIFFLIAYILNSRPASYAHYAEQMMEQACITVVLGLAGSAFWCAQIVIWALT